MEETSLRKLQGASIDEEQRENDDGDAYMVYGIVLRSNRGDIAFTDYSRRLEQQQATASQINRFINTQEPSLLVEHDNRWKRERLFLLLFMSIFVMFGFVAFLAVVQEAKVETYTFDKTAGSLTLKRWGLLGRRIIEYPLARIANVQFKTDTDSDGDKFYKAILVLATGEHLTLHSNNPPQETQQTSDCVRQFLNL